MFNTAIEPSRESDFAAIVIYSDVTELQRESQAISTLLKTQYRRVRSPSADRMRERLRALKKAISVS